MNPARPRYAHHDLPPPAPTTGTTSRVGDDHVTAGNDEPAPRALVVMQYGLAVAGLVEMLRRDHGMAAADDVDTLPVALSRLRTATPGLVVVGAECLMPQPAAAMRSLRAAANGARIVLLAHQAQRAWTALLVEHGADAVLFHESPAADIARGLRDALDGRVHLDPRAQAELLRNLASPQARGTTFTPREVDVLRLVARGMSNKAIGRELGTTEGVIKSHLRRLRQRLGARNRTEATICAIALGLVTAER